MTRRRGWLSRLGRLCHLGFLFGCDHIHNPGYLHELGLSEFPQDGLQFRALYKTGQLEVILGAVLHVCVCVSRILDQVAAPYALLDPDTLILIGQLNAHRDINGC